MTGSVTLWTIAAIAAACAEMFTGTFYLLAIAAGGFVAAGLAWAGFALTAQLAGFAAATFVGAAGVRLLRKKDAVSEHVQHPDVGREVVVRTVDAAGEAQVSYRGAVWRARALPGVVLAPGRWRIAQVDGAALLLEPAGER